MDLIYEDLDNLNYFDAICQLNRIGLNNVLEDLNGKRMKLLGLRLARLSVLSRRSGFEKPLFAFQVEVKLVLMIKGLRSLGTRDRSIGMRTNSTFCYVTIIQNLRYSWASIKSKSVYQVLRRFFPRSRIV